MRGKACPSSTTKILPRTYKRGSFKLLATPPPVSSNIQCLHPRMYSVHTVVCPATTYYRVHFLQSICPPTTLKIGKSIKAVGSL